MSWLFKSKQPDQTLQRLSEAINKKNGSRLVSPGNSTLFTTELPFYKGIKLYTYVDLSYTPYFQQQLLDNGNVTFVLDGTQTPFIEANSISPLILTSKNIISYTRLILSNIQKNDCSYRLVTSIDDVEFSSEPSDEQYTKLKSSIKTPRIKKDKDSFYINSAVLFNDSVLDVLIKVSLDGRLDIIKEKKILDNMPIRELVPEM